MKKRTKRVKQTSFLLKSHLFFQRWFFHLENTTYTFKSQGDNFSYVTSSPNTSTFLSTRKNQQCVHALLVLIYSYFLNKRLAL